MANSSRGRLGIVVGGGPAPGINGVISSVTIEAVNQGLEVVGIRDGFKNLVNGDIAQVRALTIPDVAPSIRRAAACSARAAPTRPRIPRTWPTCSMGSTGSGSRIWSRSAATTRPSAAARLRHRGREDQGRPRSQDDRQRPAPARRHSDLRLRTARHYGVQLVRNLHEDAKTTTRWYVIVSMGRAAGHLALGIGKASAATVTIIAEEFQGQRSDPRTRLRHHHRLDDQAQGAQGKGYGWPCWPKG